MREQFDFSKPEDQKKFEKDLDREDRQKIKDAAYEQAAELKDLVKSGEAKDYDEAEEKRAEKILKEREEIENWIEKDSCEPKKIPEFFLKIKKI